MPTFFALLLASCISFLTGRIPLHLPMWVDFFLASAVWLVVFIFTKKILQNLRP